MTVPPTPSAPSAPSDAGARRHIRESLAENLFVEAGAGTGKTTALIGRILALVDAGVALSELAVITFTTAAAAELRERLRHGLEEVAAADPAGPAATALRQI